MALSRFLHFYKRGLSKSTRLCSSFSSSSKSFRENSMKDYVATEQKSQVEDSDLNKEMKLEITKPAFRLSISWNAIKETFSNFRAMLRSPTYHNKMTAEGTVSVGDNKPNKSEEDSLSGKPLRTIGDIRKARSKSVLQVAAKDSIKLKSNSQIHLSTGQGNLSKYFIRERFSKTKPK